MEAADQGNHLEVLGHDFFSLPSLEALMLATLRECAQRRVPCQPWKPSSPFMPGLALGPDPLLARVAFLVSFGDREANKKLDCFRVAKRTLVWNRLDSSGHNLSKNR